MDDNTTRNLLHIYRRKYRNQYAQSRRLRGQMALYRVMVYALSIAVILLIAGIIYGY